MAIPDLLGKLKGKGEEIPQTFLALVVTDELVQSAVWQITQGTPEITALGTPVEWNGETGTTTELISAADATVSSALDGLSVEPNEVVVGVEPSWVDAQGILGSKRNLLKAICKELALKAIGLVVLTDSTLHYLKKEEGTPTTCILVNVGLRHISLLLVQLGRIEATELISRSEDIVEDVASGISHFPQLDHLPSRIIVQSSLQNPSDVVQSLLTFDWQKKFNFLHIPKIESLPRDTAIRSLILAGGAAVAQEIGSTVADLNSEESPVSPEPIDSPSSPVEASGEGVAEPAEDSSEGVAPTPLLTASDVGFSLGDTDPVSSEPIISPPPPPSRKLPTLQLPHLSLPQFSLPRVHFSRLPLILGGLILLVLVGLFTFLFYLLPQAKITLFLTPTPLEESLPLTLSSTITSPDSASSLIPATVSTETLTSTQTIPTTGNSTIGDPARGTVTIYNRTTLVKTFPKGTVLTSNSLKFTLDQDTTIASKSAGTDYVDIPGKASAAITAATFGTAGNLGSGSEFVVASFSKDTYIAKNEQALAGGTSQDVQVVGKEDSSSLTKTLTDTIIQDARASLESRREPGFSYYVLTSSPKTVQSDFSAKIGEVANSLTGTLELELSILRYANSDVENLISSRLSEAIPPGYSRLDSSPSISLTDVTETKDGEVSATAKITVLLLPTLDQASLINSLRGKSLAQSISILQTLPGYADAQITVTPHFLPPRLKLLPRNPKHIELLITPAAN